MCGRCRSGLCVSGVGGVAMGGVCVGVYVCCVGGVGVVYVWVV